MPGSVRMPSLVGPALVVGVDFRARSVRAIEHAFGMLACGSAREVHLVHVVDPDRADAAVRRAVPDALAELAREIAPDVSGIAWAHVRQGRVALELRRLAFDVGADVIVLGDPEPGGTLDLERYNPFSVLHAGSALELDARPFRTSRCPACVHARAVAEPFCERHARPGVPPRAIVQEALEARVLH